VLHADPWVWPHVDVGVSSKAAFSHSPTLPPPPHAKLAKPKAVHRLEGGRNPGLVVAFLSPQREPPRE